MQIGSSLNNVAAGEAAHSWDCVLAALCDLVRTGNRGTL